MEFDSKYYESEVREGFFIPGMVKRSWAAQLQVLEVVSNICEKHNISWFADCGTLLGAIRHKGFIPWDDDLDICMLRNDYNRFLAIAQDELPNDYQLLSLDTNAEYDKFIARITNGTSINMNAEYLMSHAGFPYVAGIDIFPLDYLYEDSEIEEERCKKAKELWDRTQHIQDTMGEKNEREIAKLLREIETMYKQCSGKNSQYVALMPFWTRFGNHKYPIDYFKEYVEMEFETTKIRVPAAFNKVLEIEYGRWEQVNRVGGIHNYPYYIEQEEILFENNGIRPYKYTFTPNDLNNEARAEHEASADINRKRIVLLERAHELIIKAMEGRDYDTTLSLLVKCQEIAITVGNDIDEKIDGESETVHKLEDYCETIYQIYNKCISGDKINTYQLSKKLKSIVNNLQTIYAKEVQPEKEILFLPVRYSDFTRFKRLYEDVSANNKGKVSLMPIPYYERDNVGLVTTEHYDGELFANDYPIIDYREYDFSCHHPDAIYIQNPWDEYESGTTIDPRFYSCNLKGLTNKLVYMPYLELDEVDPNEKKAMANLPIYAVSPGVINSDEVLVESEQTRLNYIEALTEKTGYTYRKIWETKIKVYRCELANSKNTNNNCKQILFYAGVSESYLNSEEYIKKLLAVIDIFRTKKDTVRVIWVKDNTFEANILKICPGLFGKYEDLQKSFENDGIGCVKYLDEAEKLLDKCDAYYGSPGYLMNLSVKKKIPTMIWNVSLQ